MDSASEHHLDTIAVSAGRPERVPDGSVNPPIVASSTYHAGGPYGYGREWNETTSYAEDILGQLEGGTASLYSSGMAAANAVFDLIPQGGVIVAPNHAYTAVGIRIKELHDAGHLVARFVNVADAEALAAEIRGSATGDNAGAATWVWLETPTNPLMEICDLPSAIVTAHEVGAKVVVDNTFMTPARQRPLSLGADVVMHSVTKGLAGHSDLLMGGLVTRDEALAQEFVKRRIFLGAAPSAFDSFLAARGMRTLMIRIDRAEANAILLAQRLASHPAIKAVYYPGLVESHGAQIHAQQADGPGVVLSFDIHGTVADADAICEAVTVMTYATSLGGVESLIERRRRWAHENIEVPETLIRLSVGIENVEDLWADLNQALNSVR